MRRVKTTIILSEHRFRRDVTEALRQCGISIGELKSACGRELDSRLYRKVARWLDKTNVRFLGKR